MATFPTLTPSSRTFTPGRHPHSEIPTLDGLQIRVRSSNVILEQRLRLTFIGLTEAQMISIRSHYIGQQGRFLSFAIPTSLLSGMTTPAAFTPAGYSWIYAGAPQVEDIPCAQRYNVTVELVTEPPEGVNVNGAELTITASIQGGVVADNGSAGAALTVTTSLAAGVSVGVFDFTDSANIGLPVQGGFFAGLISHTADGVATHALIVAPRATGATGTGGGGQSYTLTTDLQWKTAGTTTAGTTSTFDGAANTAAMVTAGIADHPAAEFCVDLSIDGYTDWYLPARDELDIAYFNLKPGTSNNVVGGGVNSYSVPKRTTAWTAGSPAQTSVAAFQGGGAEAFIGATGTASHWSSSEVNSSVGWNENFNNGQQGTNSKTAVSPVRAFRKVAL